MTDELKREHPQVLRWLPALSLAATATFGLLVVFYDHFYSRFNIRPEEVGFDRVAILSRAAGLLVVMGFFGYLLYAGIVPRASLTGNYRQIVKRTRVANILFVVAGLIIGIVSVLRAGVYGLGVAVTLPLLPILGIGLAQLDWASSSRSWTGPVPEQWPERQRYISTWLVAILTVAATFSGLLYESESSARNLSRGHGVRPYNFLGFPVLDYSASLGDLFWTGLPAAEPIALKSMPKSSRVFYLGSANGLSVFYIYDKTGSTVLRVPSVSVTFVARA